MMTVARFRLLCAAVVLAASVAAPTAHAAPPTDPVKAAERLNKKAMEDYDSLEFDSAAETLKNAIAKLRDAGKDETPTAARIYVSLGVVYISGLKDRSRGVLQFIEALKIDFNIQMDPERATPELQEAFDEAKTKIPESERGGKKMGANLPEGQTPEGGAKPGEEVSGLRHEPVAEGKAGEAVSIHAQLGSDVNASRLFLFYRAAGSEDFVLAPMAIGKEGDWVGTIPADAMKPGKSVQYYIDARDSRNRPAAASGSASSPYIMFVTGGAIAAVPLATVENGRDARCLEARFRDSNPVLCSVKAAEVDRGYGRIFFNLMVGTGLGIEPAGNQFEVAYAYRSDASIANGGSKFQPQTVSNTGVASSPLHGALELGVNVNRHIAISVMGRLEGTLVNNADSSDPASMSLTGGTAKATSAFAGMLQVRYNFGEGRLKPSLHLGVGGGQIRHIISASIDPTQGDKPLTDYGTAQYYSGFDPYDTTKFKTTPPFNTVCADPTNCTDTIAIGFFLVSVGGGVYYDLVKMHNGGFGIIADVNALFALGGQFGINFDLQVGIGAHFL